ncbi:MAG: Rossmann fold nucleotide-binding protein Smf possibly involved in DNA uptake, partial [uncultured Sphingomonas sp.]
EGSRPARPHPADPQPEYRAGDLSPAARPLRQRGSGAGRRAGPRRSGPRAGAAAVPRGPGPARGRAGGAARRPLPDGGAGSVPARAGRDGRCAAAADRSGRHPIAGPSAGGDRGRAQRQRRRLPLRPPARLRPGAGRCGGRVRPRPWDRLGGARRSAGQRHRRGDRGRDRCLLPARKRGPAARDVRARAGCRGNAARYRAAGPALPLPQPDHRRAERRHGGGRGGAALRLADHRAAGGRDGAGGDGGPRLAAGPARAGLQRADPRRRYAGPERRGRAGGHPPDRRRRGLAAVAFRPCRRGARHRTGRLRTPPGRGTARPHSVACGRDRALVRPACRCGAAGAARTRPRGPHRSARRRQGVAAAL